MNMMMEGIFNARKETEDGRAVAINAEVMDVLAGDNV